MSLLPARPLEKLVGEEGFEPSLPDSESGVLPLDDSPMTEALESKSRPLPAFSHGIIIPSNLPQKTRQIGQLLQSQLSNPRNPSIISPHPADINAPISYSSSLPLLKSYYKTLTRNIKKYAFLRIARAWIPASYRGKGVVPC